ncbi:hypothetical protein E2C01_020314 [Portunus trituberculatus]|uniref:Uncharacterized protein n=1 Tax=Portunus trituberculatus TaxID=210409 RepID=A0A5B7DZK0_PORTR|nr:hypothetical protein [Portunus trituberculatus]
MKTPLQTPYIATRTSQITRRTITTPCLTSGQMEARMMFLPVSGQCLWCSQNSSNSCRTSSVIAVLPLRFLLSTYVGDTVTQELTTAPQHYWHTLTVTLFALTTKSTQGRASRTSGRHRRLTTPLEPRQQERRLKALGTTQRRPGYHLSETPHTDQNCKALRDHTRGWDRQGHTTPPHQILTTPPHHLTKH